MPFSDEDIRNRYIVRDRIKALVGLRMVNAVGTIPCPICEFGSVHYTIGRRGHISAHCTTEDCVKWKEGIPDAY